MFTPLSTHAVLFEYPVDEGLILSALTNGNRIYYARNFERINSQTDLYLGVLEAIIFDWLPTGEISYTVHPSTALKVHPYFSLANSNESICFSLYDWQVFREIMPMRTKYEAMFTKAFTTLGDLFIVRLDMFKFIMAKNISTVGKHQHVIGKLHYSEF
jgi:hypothetical protein